MSSFQVSNDCLAAVLDGIEHVKKQHGCYPHFPEALKADPQTLWAKLGRLNAEAVSQRYNEAPGETDPAPEPRNPFFAGADMVDCYKAIRCLLYQCSEGDVPKRPLFKAMRECNDLLAHQIVSGLSAYERSEMWG